MKRDTLGAFVPGTEVEIAGAGSGPLKGLSFAAKDIFDVAGTVTGCGNPDWASGHDPAAGHAVAVERLLVAGADLAGKTITDELAFSLNGQNPHYGTPTNANAPGRIPGGSSSGSASAVAGGLVDLALGSDTGGSVRIPASYCGLFGLRPTHGRISLAGVMPLAPSLDTVGCFAREAGALSRAFAALFDRPGPGGGFRRLLRAEDAFALAEPAAAEVLEPLLRRLEAVFGAAEDVTLAPEGEGLADWVEHFRAILGGEAWASHRGWIAARRPSLGPELAQRFEWARGIPEAEIAAARDAREAVAGDLAERLGDDALLCLPTAPGIAPRIDATEEALLDHRYRVHRLTCIAGLARLPQISLPLASLDGCPLGLSLIGGPGTDEKLLALAETLETPESPTIYSS
ncbi:MAG: amidase [Kiloniellales bacterium]|nr:amidase [Kiloniellales bacterium]